MKPIGNPGNPVEETIEDVIRAAPLFRGGQGMLYGPVSGGISNENWRVRAADGAGDWFVKVPGNGTEMFIDRVAAFDASRKAAEAGLGPRVYDDLAERGIEINDFLPEHRPSTHSDFADPVKRQAAIAAYRRMHALPRLHLTKTIFDMIDEHRAQVAFSRSGLDHAERGHGARGSAGLGAGSGAQLQRSDAGEFHDRAGRRNHADRL